MKNWMLLAAALTLTACASAPGADYSAAAAEHSLADFFPSDSYVRSFPTTEEAYDFIMTAQYKLQKVSQKQPAKGLAAKLIGPALKHDQPVFVVSYLLATTANTRIDLSKVTGPLDAPLREAVAVTSVFLVFGEDRAVSISKFYLTSGYQYTSNRQFHDFSVGGQSYQADYPVGWGAEEAFQYLRKEKD